MYFPLSMFDISLWCAAVAIILLMTSELLAATKRYANIVIRKRNLRIASIVMSAAFLVTVI